MQSQILEITQPGLLLRLKAGFVEVHDKNECIGRVVIDDLLCVLINIQGCSISSNLIDTLSHQHIPVVICGKNYLPSSLVLPITGKSRQLEVMRAQMQISEPHRKRSWQTIIKSKLNNQATLLEQLSINAAPLRRLASQTRSGDPDNCEAQGARYYWRRLFGDNFRRNRDQQGINSLLNYSYTVLRATMARGIVAAGLHPTYSLHHRHPQNPINLVDDMMEPFRPVCDSLVNLYSNHSKSLTLTTDVKKNLAQIVNKPVLFAGDNSPLSIACVKVARSFADTLTNKNQTFLMPSLASQIEMADI